MSGHHDRVRAVLVVHGLEAECRASSGRPAATVEELTDRVARVQLRLDYRRARPADGCLSDILYEADTGASANEWMLAVYDAALIELCVALGVEHSLADEAVCAQAERQRVELELLSSVLPLQ